MIFQFDFAIKMAVYEFEKLTCIWAFGQTLLSYLEKMDKKYHHSV